MNSTVHHLERLSRVRAQVHYLVPMLGKPTTYVDETPAGVPRHNARYAPYATWIHDARPLAARVSLEREGFTLQQHESAVSDFWDDEEVRSVYYPELEQLVCQVIGARLAHVFDHTRRRRTKDRSPLDGNQLTFSTVREPVAKAHCDFTPTSARARLSRELGASDSEQERRFAIINVWRPINPEPILDAPLAVLDAASFEMRDMIASDLVYADRVGETYNLTYAPGHRWFYFPKQSRREALLFKNFDSGSAVAFTPHTAFEDPEAPVDAPLRESIEARLFAFF